jgi:hypothetical protein
MNELTHSTLSKTNGITPLLTKSLTPSELCKHQGDLCLVMEVMIRKYDKFGWDRMQDGMRKLIRMDWLDALQDYPLDEVRRACRLHTLEMPNKVPNEGHIKGIIVRERGKVVAALPKPVVFEEPREEPSAEAKARVAAMTAEIVGKMRVGGAA